MTIEHSDAYYDYKRNDPDRENPFTDPKDRARAERVVSGISKMNVDTDGNDLSHLRMFLLLAMMPISSQSYRATLTYRY